MSMEKTANKKTWPKQCIWPEPADVHKGVMWNEDPVRIISEAIHYRFGNENLLRQAFTRRAFQIEYGLSGSGEELEFFGDSILSFIASKELMKHFVTIRGEDSAAPCQAARDEGEMTRIRSTLVCKEHLANRCVKLGLDRFILYGTGEPETESAKEDAMEALIGAVAMDCGWNMDVLEDVVDRLINLQVENVQTGNFYEQLNAWHRRHFGRLPEYNVFRNGDQYSCVIQFDLPENSKDILVHQQLRTSGETRSLSREHAAEAVCRFIRGKGIWVNLADARLIPERENSINQMQELCQKKYISDLEYRFERTEKEWICSCIADGVQESGCSFSKADAKKEAAFRALCALQKAAGCYRGYMEKTPAKEYIGGLKYTAVAEILQQITPGKVITEKVFLAWLGKKYGIENLQINWKEFPYPNLRDESIPFQRFLTSKGLIEGYYKERLEKEGHILVETKTDNWRVLDYKETMADVTQLNVPDKEKAIGHAEHFLNFVNGETRETLEKGLRERGILR